MNFLDKYIYTEPLKTRIIYEDRDFKRLKEVFQTSAIMLHMNCDREPTIEIPLDNALNFYPAPSIGIKGVIFNNPATIVIWVDGTKTVVKSERDEKFDPEKGLAMAISKRVFGDKGNYYNLFKKWLPKEYLDSGKTRS